MHEQAIEEHVLAHHEQARSLPCLLPTLYAPQETPILSYVFTIAFISWPYRAIAPRQAYRRHV